jgi:vacuolar-type H+-ATPase subunit H
VADDDLAVVSRLKAHEEELSRRLREARQVAEARVFDAREAAARLEALEEANRRQEIARLRDERERQLGVALDGVRDDTARQIAFVTERAAANRQRVLLRLLGVVIGSGTP